MILKWSDYLKIHPSNQDYDTNAAALQKLISNSESPKNSFHHLNENKTVILCFFYKNKRNKFTR